MLFEKIIELCKQNNTNISEVERVLKFGNGTIRRWKVNQPTIGKLTLVADYFGVSLDYFTSNVTTKDNKDNKEFLNLIKSLTEEQKNLVRCYISIIKQNA